MKTIEQIKEEYAKERENVNFRRELESYLEAGDSCVDSEPIERIIDRIAQRAFNAALELAAEKVKTKRKVISETSMMSFTETVVDKESILSLKINN